MKTIYNLMLSKYINTFYSINIEYIVIAGLYIYIYICDTRYFNQKFHQPPNPLPLPHIPLTADILFLPR